MKKSSFAAMKSGRLPKKTTLAIAIQTSIVAATIAQGSANAATITVTSTADDGRGGCTLREAIVSINDRDTGLTGCNRQGTFGVQDTVVVDSRLGRETITLTQGELSPYPYSMGIQGNGITIDGANSSRIFSINATDVTMSDLTLTGGRASTAAGGAGSGQGGAIRLRNFASLHLNNCTLSNNSSEGFGGAIDADFANSLVISNSSITNNTATAGSGIRASDTNLSISSSTISSNSTTQFGGAISIGFGSFELTSSSVTGNSGPQTGGIDIYRTDSLQISGSNISGNTAQVRYAGGIRIRSAYGNYHSGTIRNSTILNNTTAGDGGGLSSTYFNLEIIDTNITGNTAAGYGGGIHSTFSSTGINFTGGEISNNAAPNLSGGAIFAEEADFTLQQTTVSGNAAKRGGGGIYNRGNDLTIEESNISSNSATEGYGGGIAVLAGSLTINDSSLSSNFAYYDGGGIRGALGVSLTVSNSTLSDNRASLHGGAMHFGAVLGEVENSTISNNYGVLGGGGIYVNDAAASLELKNTTVFNNTSNAAIDGIALYNGSSLTFTNSILAGSGTNIECLAASGSAFTSDTASIIQDGSCVTPARAVDPHLRPLEDNGGFTRTHALAPNSPARDTGIVANCTINDQRGQLRDDGDSLCDVGAIEFNRNDDTGFFIIPIPGGRVVVVPE